MAPETQLWRRSGAEFTQALADLESQKVRAVEEALQQGVANLTQHQIGVIFDDASRGFLSRLSGAKAKNDLFPQNQDLPGAAIDTEIQSALRKIRRRIDEITASTNAAKCALDMGRVLRLEEELASIVQCETTSIVQEDLDRRLLLPPSIDMEKGTTANRLSRLVSGDEPVFSLHDVDESESTLITLTRRSVLNEKHPAALKANTSIIQGPRLKLEVSLFFSRLLGINLIQWYRKNFFTRGFCPPIPGASHLDVLCDPEQDPMDECKDLFDPDTRVAYTSNSTAKLFKQPWIFGYINYPSVIHHSEIQPILFNDSLRVVNSNLLAEAKKYEDIWMALQRG